MARPTSANPLATEYVVDRFGLVDHTKLDGAKVAATAEASVDEQARLLWAIRQLDDKGNPTALHGVVNMRPRPDNIYNKDSWGFNDWLTLKHTICYQVSRGGDHRRSRVIELGDTPIGCWPIPQHDPTHSGL
jgi:hypothetical protein